MKSFYKINPSAITSKNMTIRSATAEDLEKFKSLVEYKEYFDSNNIWLEQSKVCVANNGDLLGFTLIKPNSLIDFFKGKIPSRIGATEEHNKWLNEEFLRLRNNQYEVLFYVKEIEPYYLSSDDVDTTDIQYALSTSVELDENKYTIDALLWSRIKTPDYMCYNSFNDIVYYDITFID